MDITKTLKGAIIYDLEGNRMFSKIFDESIDDKQYEKTLLAKTRKQRIKDEILILDNTLVVHKFVNELHFYIVGCKGENPLVLDSVLECLVDVITSLLNKSVERHSFQKKLAQIVLAFDEICDNGMIIEIDSSQVLSRVCLKDDLAEQTMTQRLQSATEQFKFSWIRSYS